MSAKYKDDYDSHADKFWSIYDKEAKTYDKAIMETWKDDMDSIIIFAGLFSAVLTAFLIDASTRLKTNTTDQTNALLNQTVVLLAQISRQLGPNGSQIITSPSQQLEPFQLNASDLRVNIFWFMSLGFSLTAALGATLVQQWVRDYLQVFQRSNALERSRMRQFLFHGLTHNNMHLVVECIPAFIHISLFLFFIGLADNLFSTNKAVAIPTTVIIGFCALFYVGCSIFPAIYAQTLFHTPLSIIFWKIRQIIHPRKYHDRSDTDVGTKTVSVSSDMAKGRLQLAMKGHFDNRKARDTEAICWVLTKIIGDTEFEPFIASIGGSLTTKWGIDVWTSVFMETIDSRFSNTVMVLSPVAVLKTRIESLLHSCSVPISDQQTRFARACTCIDGLASLTLLIEAKLKLDIDNDLMNGVLGYFGDEKRKQEKPAQDSLSGSGMRLRQLPGNQEMDTLLEIKWKCLVLIGMKKALRSNSEMAYFIKAYESCVSSIYENDAITSRAQEVDRELLKAWSAAQQLYSELSEKSGVEWTEESLDKLVPHWRDHIEAMRKALHTLNSQVNLSIDEVMIVLNGYLHRMTQGTLEHMEDIVCAWPLNKKPLAGMSMINWKELDFIETCPPDILGRFVPHLVPPRLLIYQLLGCADPKRLGPTSKFNLVGLDRLLNNPELRRLFGPLRPGSRNPQPYVNQFWRFKDIKEHGGAGFIIEMFFATFRSLEEKTVSTESKELIWATLRAITDNEEADYLKTARRRFLWALWQELNFPSEAKEISAATKAPSVLIVGMLRHHFRLTDKDCLKDEEERRKN